MQKCTLEIQCIDIVPHLWNILKILTVVITCRLHKTHNGKKF